MAVEVWPTVTFQGRECWLIDGFTIVDKDPTGDALFLVKTPAGGTAAVGPIIKGDPGPHTEFIEEVDYTYLAYDDVTPDSSEIVVITEGDSDTPQVVQLKHTLRQGPKGEDGDTILDPEDFPQDPVSKMYPAINAAGDAFELVSPKVGDRYFPAEIANVPSGNPTYTMAQIAVPAQLFDWRPEPHFSSEITGTGPDVKVDLVARLGTTGILNPETGGNEIGRGFGSAGQYPPTPVMIPGPPAGSSQTFDRVLAGAPAVVYFRTERQSGVDTYTATANRTRIWLKVNPIP